MAVARAAERYDPFTRRTRVLHTRIWSTPSKARCSLQFHPHPLGEALEVLDFYLADAHGESLLANVQGDLRKKILEFQ
jgi:hypothetical protein